MINTIFTESLNIKHVKNVSDKISRYMIGFNIPETEDYIGITEWENGEGVNISFGDDRHISLHYDELEAINYLVKVMDHES